MSNMVVATNVLALNGHRNLKTVGANQTKASSRLSSGYKINSAADDAAGLAISEKMRAQIRGLDMASKNTQDGVSLIQTAEGGMQEIDNMLQRIRELVDQSANDTNENNFSGTGDRDKIQDEINQLIKEIDSMADRTEFNKKKVIDGSYADVTESFATAKAEQKAYSGVVNHATKGIKNASTAVTTQKGAVSGAKAAIATKGASIEIRKARGLSTATLESGMSSLKSTLTGAQTKLASVSKEYDTLKTMNKQLKALSNTVAGLSGIKGKGSTTLHFQVGANSNQSLYLNINSIKSDILGIGDGKGNSKIDVVQSTGADITGYLSVMDKALSYVTTERSKLGAAQNRLEYTQKSLDISSENLSAAESRVRDADMAKEMMNMTKANVLQQAATSMLAQANQAPQNILQLLG